MTTLARTRASARAALSALLTLLLVVGGVSLSALPASAATGDVTSATLQWGIKSSFRNYIKSPIAKGLWTLAGGVTDATPFSWTGGTGTASQTGATGSVGYAGSIHFQGHQGTGVGPEEYALDLTISNVRVVQSSATAAQLLVDTYSNSLAAPGEFVTSNNVVFADLALAGGTATSTATTVGFSGVPATLTAAGAVAFAGFYGEGTALDPVTFAWPTEQAPVPPTPTVTVSKSTEISPAGEIVTVTGTGFAPVAPGTNAVTPPLAGQFGGAYVTFGKFADVWKPSAGAPSSARKNFATAWVVNPDKLATIGGTAAGGVAINPDGSFSVQLLVTRDITGEPATGNFGIYTYGGGSSKYAPFESYTPITFSTAPAVKLSKTAGLNPLGEAVTVKGWNFGPNAPGTNAITPPLAGQFGGAYVTFGKYAEVWKPSAGAASAVRKNGSVAWVVNPANLATVGGAAAGGVAINADGSFTATLTASRGFTGEPATGNYGIYTYGGGSSKYAPFETYTPVAFTAAAATTTTLTSAPATGLVAGGSTTISAQVSPVTAGTISFASGNTVLQAGAVDAAGLATVPVTGLAAGDTTVTATFTPSAPLLFAASSSSITVTAAAPTVGAGSLSWGIKQSFRDYVTGTIAKGSISTSGAGVSGGQFTFGQAAGGNYSAATGLGSSPYSGSVRFQGHAGLLDVSIGNPTVTVTSASSATLNVQVNGAASIPFATLSLAAGTKSTPNNTVTYSGVPAVLTAQGAAVFSFNGSSFYSAGTALDPVTFTIGSKSSIGSTATVAAYKGAKTPAATPPATTGVVVDGDSYEEQGEITAEADGFAANEKNILVVIYSSPVLLATVTADAAGVARWSGNLPEGLTGEHTLTFQGSVNRGIVLDIQPASATTAAAFEGCLVDDAALTWGFKESFRSYISGSIANGEWTVADGAAYEVPNFSWAEGTGAYELSDSTGGLDFTGSITFTGHDGVLNTTVANPTVRFIDADTAFIDLDVSGTTQEGTAVSQLGVEFVELDLSAATVDAASDGTVTISGAPAVLSDAGSAAFGTYEAGEEFDPVTLVFSTEADCGEASAPVAATPADAAPIDAEPTSSNFSWLIWVLLALVLIIAAIVVIVIVRRRSAIAS